jgi:hypothetical protein
LRKLLLAENLLLALRKLLLAENLLLALRKCKFGNAKNPTTLNYPCSLHGGLNIHLQRLDLLDGDGVGVGINI